jgi:Uma2 family endonuclease
MTIATAPNTPNNVLDTQPLLLDVSNTRLTVTSEQFDRLCLDNPNLRLELTPNKELIVMALTGGESGIVRLGLLVNPQDEKVEIYRPGQDVRILASPTSIDCSDVMPGFVLSMSKIW